MITYKRSSSIGLRLRYSFGAAASARALPGRGHTVLRRIDKYAGVPAVFCLGLLRRKRSLPAPIRRIGLLNTAAIGDTVLMSAPLTDLRSAHKNADIILLVGPSNYEAARMLNHANRVVRLPIPDLLSCTREIRLQKLDVLLDFGPWARLNSILAALSGARFIAGFRTPGQYRHYVYDAAVEHSGHAHQLENYRELLSVLGVPMRHRPRIVRCDITEEPDVAADRDAPYMIFHLWPGGTAAWLKQWPAERWLELAGHFIRQGYRIVLTGGQSQKADNDKLIEAIDPRLRPSVSNHAGLSLECTAALLARAALVVSVDTGVMHLAAALDAPLVALMGPACRRRWGPVAASASVVESPMVGCGYLNLGFEIPRHPPRCMEAISVEAVLQACLKALARGVRDGRGVLHGPPVRVKLVPSDGTRDGAQRVGKITDSGPPMNSRSQHPA